MNHTWQIIRTQEEFDNWIYKLGNSPVAVDVETRGTRPGSSAYLLGTAITGRLSWSFGQYISAYVPANIDISFFLKYSDKIIGWNVPFDKTWLDYHYKVDTKWHADGRIMWYLQNNDPAIRGFGLKLAQKKLLGWSESNDKELEEHIKSKGGKISNGDHYLADTSVLAFYACLDTYSTLLCYEKLSTFMDSMGYWQFAHSILEYGLLLKQSADQGLKTSEVDLIHAAQLYKYKREQAGKELRISCEKEINAIEEAWKSKKAASFKRDSNKQQYLDSPLLFRKFNPSSSQQRALLLHTMLEFPILERTETGMPKTDRANISLIKHKGAAALLKYSEYKKIAEQAETYLKHVQDGRLYTNYDVCGTVSGRLAGFKPSLLNMPFSEDEVMSAFTVDEGYIGVHADLAAIEPCILAHYSGDPTLLKVYQDGMGDIYLDLDLDIFPNNLELKELYNPLTPVNPKIKEHFRDLRAVGKIIHLAVSYTGTYITVAKNLTKNGFPTTKGEAMALVKRYWTRFAKVKEFNNKLQQIYSDKGYLRNIVGRVVQVPDIYKKDLMNRLIQSSAHDILCLWVMEIISQFKVHKVEWKHWLPDLHDSTTFQVLRGQEELARQCYETALLLVEREVYMSVPLRMEFKTCSSLAGIKGKD